MIRVLSAVSLAALLLAAPAFAADGDCLTLDKTCKATPDQVQVLQAPQQAQVLAGVNDRIWVPDDDYLKTLSI